MDTITLLTQDSGTIMADVDEQAYLATSDAFPGFSWETDTRDRLVRQLVDGFMKSHTVGEADKSPQSHSGDDVTVEMHSYYDYVSIPDYQAENESTVVAAIKKKSVGYYARSLNALIFGTHIWGANKSAALTTVTSAVDGTVASWEDALAKVPNANVIVLDNRAKGMLRTAYAAGASTNTLRDQNVTEIAGIPVIFVKLLSAAPEEGDVVGAVVDGTKLVAIAEPVTSYSEFDPSNDRKSFETNTVSFGYRARMGFALANDSDATLLTLGGESI